MAEASHVKEQYLLDALKARKQGRAVTVTETPPMGCMIRKARKKDTVPEKISPIIAFCSLNHRSVKY